MSTVNLTAVFATLVIVVTRTSLACHNKTRLRVPPLSVVPTPSADRAAGVLIVFAPLVSEETRTLNVPMSMNVSVTLVA